MGGSEDEATGDERSAAAELHGPEGVVCNGRHVRIDSQGHGYAAQDVNG